MARSTRTSIAKHRSYLNQQFGFSLLEMVIAIFLVSLLSGSCIVGVNSIYRMHLIAKHKIESIQQIQTITGIFQHNIAMAGDARCEGGVSAQRIAVKGFADSRIREFSTTAKKNTHALMISRCRFVGNFKSFMPALYYIDKRNKLYLKPFVGRRQALLNNVQDMQLQFSIDGVRWNEITSIANWRLIKFVNVNLQLDKLKLNIIEPIYARLLHG